MKAPLPDNETQRLGALRDLTLLDTPPESGFESLVELASFASHCPVALVSLVDHERQWFKARVGLSVCETHRDYAFCSHAILRPAEPLIVEDALRDPRFADNPLVVGTPGIRFYCGIPVLVEGKAVGTLCVIDYQPRVMPAETLIRLKQLAHQVELTIAARRHIRGLETEGQSLLQQVRTNAQSEAMLIRERDDAVAANAAKSLFLASMSHEIRTPLSTLIGFLDLLADTPLSTQQTEYLGLMKHSSEALLSVVNNVLDVSKIEAGHLEVENVGFDVMTVIREVLELNRLRAEHKGLRCLGPSSEVCLPSVMADPARVRQVLLNLLGNALKFTQRGSIHVTAEPRLLSGEAPCVCITVRDSGPGLKPEEAERLFRSYAQANTTVHRQHGGTGLGLFISKQLVELMGGRIGVESTPGQGAAFWFTLPCGCQ